VHVFVDIETFSEADLPKVGAYRYAEDPSTRILMAAWAVDGGEVRVETCDGGGPPADLLRLLNSPAATIHAWNAAFELAVFRSVWGLDVDLERVECDMVHAMSLALPGSLAAAGTALGMDASVLKDPIGSRLINKFSKPRRPTSSKPRARETQETDPENWALFEGYCKRDVESEREVYRRIRKWPMPCSEWAHWRQDQRINRTGLPIDADLVRGAMSADRSNRRALLAEAREITGVSNPNSVQQLRAWLQSRGCALETLDKAAVSDALAGDLDDTTRRVLEIRKELSKTSTKKFDALDRATCADSRLRGAFQFYGASRTGRWAGRIFQPQNLPRGTIKSVDVLHDTVERVRSGGTATADELVSCIRSAVRAPAGTVLAVADLANIESRILGWISNAKRMLQCFDTGGDIYRDFGQELFNLPAAELTKAQRNYSKPPCLGCGYGLGADGLVAYAAGMGQDMTKEEAQHAVGVFRDAYWEVPRLWRGIEDATFAVVNGDAESMRVGRLRFERDGRWLFMVLPSGRRLAYLDPKIESRPAPWGGNTDTLTYMGMDQYTRKWTRLSTFGGKWVEQACQSISRDLLAHGLAEAERTGFQIVMHTHDEIAALVDDGSWLDHDVLSWCMTRPPQWADRRLYLGAEGFTDTIYRKD